MQTFWQELIARKGFLRLQAPMEGVTDISFRAWLRQFAAPDVYFTEFSSLSALLDGQQDTLRRLSNTLPLAERQWPLVAQLWGNDPQQLRAALLRLVAMGFDGVDLNFGCPHKKIVAKPAGSGLLQAGEQYRALAMLQSCLQARTAGEIPASFGISVKTRLGFQQPDWGFLTKLLQCQGLDALIVHFRLASVPRWHINHKDNPLWSRFGPALPQALQDGPCYWQYSSKLMELRAQVSQANQANQATKAPLLIGNGGLGPFHWSGPAARGASWLDAQATGLDGWMAARALFDDPLYLGRQDYSRNHWHSKPLSQRLDLLLQHLQIYQRFYCEGQLSQYPNAYEIFKKFYRVYLPKSLSNDYEKRLCRALQSSANFKEAVTILTGSVLST